jgi:hypothetical protein
MAGALTIAAASPAAALPCALPTSGSSFAVTSEADLVTLSSNADCWAEDIVQTADIVLSAPNANLASIGTNATAFTGTYSGQNHSITGLAITGTDDDRALFGAVSDATISNLSVSGSVTGASGLGGIIGGALRSTLSYLTSDVSVNGTEYLGGIVGSIEDSLIIGATSFGTVTGSGQIVGGIVGFARNSSIIGSNAKGNIDSLYSAGGVVGALLASSISQSSATGDIFCSDTCGGLIASLAGNGSSAVDQSFSTGQVQGDNRVGGLIGYARIFNGLTTSITDSYALGDVTDTDDATGGVLIGVQLIDGASNGTLTITNMYATGVVTGPTTTTYELIGGPSGSSTAIVNDSFTLAPPNPPDLTSITTFTAAGWDIDENWTTPTIWGICPDVNDGMPVLKAFYFLPGPCQSPEFSQITPDEGSTLGGDVITVTGTRLHLVTAVRLGGVDCQSFTIVSDTELTCITPAHAAGRVSFAIYYADGGIWTDDGFEYVVPTDPTDPVVPAFTG